MERRNQSEVGQVVGRIGMYTSVHVLRGSLTVGNLINKKNSIRLKTPISLQTTPRVLYYHKKHMYTVPLLPSPWLYISIYICSLSQESGYARM